MSQITDAVDVLTSKVEAQTTVNQSAIALLTGLAEQIRANANSPQKLADLASAIEAQTSSMSAAIEANTV